MVLAHDISKGDRTKDVKITQNITFETMLLAPDTMGGLIDSGFHRPSPIQLYGIPIGKCGFDLLLEAKSGTGKTAVFAIIALEKLDFRKGLQVVILTPTREIAAQICDVFNQIGSRYKELQVVVVMGGLPLQNDIVKFQNPVHIVVGSPGRVKHLIKHKHIDVQSVRLFVLDEADKLMESSFEADIKYIHTSLPKQKQVIMCSATYPQNTRDLINTYVQNASHVCPDSDCILLGIEQKISLVKYNSSMCRSRENKFVELIKILERLQFKQCLVFCNFHVTVTDVHKLLKKAGWPSQTLYGQQEQLDRLNALKTLQQYKCRILVSTDLAARGIDSSNVDLVVNFESPYDWQTYLHRIGRAGRFGSYGSAITILSKGVEQQKFREMFRSVNLTINMRYLWSDEKFIIDTAPLTHSAKPDVCDLQSENSTSANLVEKISSKEIWELLSGDSNASNSIETFESLCKFSESLEIPKIEQFSERMTFLDDKNCQDTDDDMIFKHIEIGTTSNNPSIISQNFVTVKDTDVNNMKESKDDNKSDLITKNRNNNIVILPDGPQNISDISGDTLTNKNKTGEEHDTSTKLKSRDTPTNENKTDKQHDTSIKVKSRDTLTNGNKIDDLPIMFSSSKLKSHDTKHKTNNTISYKYGSSNVDAKIDLTEDQIPSKLQMNANIYQIEDPNFYIEKETHYRNRTKLDNHYGETNNCNEKEHNPQMQKKSKSRYKGKITLESFGQNESATLYSNWYNQLKMRMKYIEQAIYIDEMSQF